MKGQRSPACSDPATIMLTWSDAFCGVL